MRTIISGPVTADTLADAEMFAGIDPTSFVTNGQASAPADCGKATDVFPICQRLGKLGEAARDYTLCQNADACIVVGGNDHLVRIATQYGLPVFEQ